MAPGEDIDLLVKINTGYITALNISGIDQPNKEMLTNRMLYSGYTNGTLTKEVITLSHSQLDAEANEKGIFPEELMKKFGLLPIFKKYGTLPRSYEEVAAK